MKYWIGFLLAATFPLFAVEILNGSGSEGPAALMQALGADYKKETGIELTYESFGREGGIRQIAARTVDFALTEKPLAKESLADDKLLQLPFLTAAGGSVTYVLLSQEKKEVNQRVQRFISWALDKDAILRNFGYTKTSATSHQDGQ